MAAEVAAHVLDHCCCSGVGTWRIFVSPAAPYLSRLRLMPSLMAHCCISQRRGMLGRKEVLDLVS